MPPAKAPSYEIKKQDPNLATFHSEIRESRPNILTTASRSRILDDNLIKMKVLAEEHASMMQQWWPPTNQTMSGSQQKKQSSTRAPSILGVEFNLEANSEKQDSGVLCCLIKDQEISALGAVVAEDEITRGHSCGSGDYLSKSDLHPPQKHSGDDGNGDLEANSTNLKSDIEYVSNFGAHSERKLCDVLEGFKSENPSNPRLNPTPSNLGVRLNRIELGKEDRGVNGSRVLHTEMNNTMEDSTQQVVPSKVVQVTKESFVDAYHMFDEMLKGNFEVFQHSKVIFVPSIDSKMVYDDMGGVCDHSIDWIGSRVYVGVTKSIECLGNHLAHKVS